MSQKRTASLERSEMFIDIPEPDHSRSGNAQCFRSWSGSRPYVSLRWSEEKSFCSRAFYKHLASNGAKATMVCCTSRLNPTFEGNGMDNRRKPTGFIQVNFLRLNSLLDGGFHAHTWRYSILLRVVGKSLSIGGQSSCLTIPNIGALECQRSRFHIRTAEHQRPEPQGI